MIGGNIFVVVKPSELGTVNTVKYKQNFLRSELLLQTIQCIQPIRFDGCIFYQPLQYTAF